LTIDELTAIPKGADVNDDELLDAILSTESQDELGLSEDDQSRGVCPYHT
jgi:hypothetical protein